MKSLLNALQEGRLVELPVADKDEALVYLAHLIEAVPDLGAGTDLVEAVKARERQANTALGGGVACPHVRATGGGDLLCAVGWSPEGIDYGAPDAKKVHLLVMYYIPDAQKNLYLKEISGLAAAIHRAGGISPIAEARDIAAVRERLLDWVAAAIEAGIPESKARMIRLEARQAAAEAAAPAAPIGGQPLVQVESVKILFVDERAVVLCRNADLSAALEGSADALKAVRAQAQLEVAGYKLICQAVSHYTAGRALFEYLGVKTL